MKEKVDSDTLGHSDQRQNLAEKSTWVAGHLRLKLPTKKMLLQMGPDKNLCVCRNLSAVEPKELNSDHDQDKCGPESRVGKRFVAFLFGFGFSPTIFASISLRPDRAIPFVRVAPTFAASS